MTGKPVAQRRKPDAGPEGVAEAPWWAARRLLRAARSGTLATSADGQPFASLVTPAAAPDGSALMLLSDLSEHTRHLRAEPRCALMVQGGTKEANPQTAPRLTVTGLAEPEKDPALKQRWLALHPYAALYAGFGDFSLWRIWPLSGLYVAGFARAHRLRRAELASPQPAIDAVAEAAVSIIAHCNASHLDMLEVVAKSRGRSGTWRMVSVDTDGCDLAQGDAVLRLSWSAPVNDANGIRRELIELARRARG